MDIVFVDYVTIYYYVYIFIIYYMNLYVFINVYCGTSHLLHSNGNILKAAVCV